jgi:hypothetical protein
MRRSIRRRKEIELRLVKPGSLPNFKLEERVIWVRMPPPEILLLLGAVRSIEITIIAVLLPKILAVSAIFVVVPGVIVFAVSIVVALFLVISVVSSRCDRSDEGSAQYECGQN